jgi:LppX_LprAFG lipoprotein
MRGGRFGRSLSMKPGGCELTRFSKVALMACTVAIAAVSGGCGNGGSGATPITDANTLITQSAYSIQNVKTIHIEVTMDGSVNTSALGASSLGASGSVKLDGTTLTGDMDVQNQAVHMTMSMPTLMGLTADIIEVDGATYTKMSLTGDKYTKSSTSDLGVTVGTPAPSASPDLSKAVTELKSALDGAGVTATIKGTDKVDGRDAYHVTLSVPIAKINSMIADQGGSTFAGMTLDTASFDYWAYKDTLNPAKMEIKGTSAALGRIDLVLTLTKYDAKVTITAPPADQIQTTP